MCDDPSIIVSQYAFYHASERVDLHMFDTVYEDVTIHSLLSGPIRRFLESYKTFPLDYVYEFVANSYYYLRGVRHPLFTVLPCGKCVYCRSDYKRELENRCIIEAAHSGSVYFYTLTYSDNFLPDTGLCKSHVTFAFKRLRNYIRDYISVDLSFTQLYIGEYGTDPNYSLRPHYHGIIFFNRFLTNEEFALFRDFFNPSPSQLSEALAYNPDLIYKLREQKIVESEFYKSHPRLMTFWPHGVIYDIQTPRKSVVHLCRYITKYITKNILVSGDFATWKEREERHYEPPFIQAPKSIGLACRWIDEYKEHILNSPDSTIYVRYQNVKGSPGLVRVKIPNIYIKKLFPTIGRLVPRCVFTAHLISGLIDFCREFNLKSCKLFDPERLQSKIERFEPYRYMLKFKLKSREYCKLQISLGFICNFATLLDANFNIYHNRHYQKLLEDSNFVSEMDFDILNIIESYLNDLNDLCSETNYNKLTFAKLNYYQNKNLPPYNYYSQKLAKDIKIRTNDHYVRRNMISSPYNNIQETKLWQKHSPLISSSPSSHVLHTQNYCRLIDKHSTPMLCSRVARKLLRTFSSTSVLSSVTNLFGSQAVSAVRNSIPQWAEQHTLTI